MSMGAHMAAKVGQEKEMLDCKTERSILSDS